MKANRPQAQRSRTQALIAEPQMRRLIVTAVASPLLKEFLMVVSVSKESDGTPVLALKASNFSVQALASLDHASFSKRAVTTVQGEDGFYTVHFKPNRAQPELFPGEHVFGLAVKVVKGRDTYQGQTIAVGNLPT